MYKVVKGFIIIVICMILVACSKVNQENFAKIQLGMSMEQVVAILGQPTTANSIDVAGLSGTSATWKNNNTEISLQFINNKLQVKNLIKGD